jgi:hypothetical protein
MSNYKPLEFKEYLKSNQSRLAQMIENPYLDFAPSKQSLGKKTMCIVEYTDLMGRKHTIKCSNKKQMREAQLFLSIFKEESLKVKQIVSQYPVKLGRIQKSYMSAFRADMKELGFTNKFINEIAGW